MDLGTPIAEANMTITSLTIGKDVSTFSCEGAAGKYGHAFVTHQVRVSDEDGKSYECEGFARALMEDGTIVSGSLRGVGRRTEGRLKLFNLDNASNGDQNLSIWDIDVVNKSVSVTVYSILKV